MLLVAGVLGATYETSPGGALWGAEKTVFPGHAQDVALTAVVNDLKKAQDILGSGQQPTPDQLTDARTSLNQAKQDMGYLSPSSEQASLQNLYLQLTQQLLQYTPDSVQQLPALRAQLLHRLPSTRALGAATDAALTSATAPSWGYPISDDAGSVAPDDDVAPPPDVPDAPAADWPQPYDPPLTPNLDDLGYYDPSWGQLYGYDPTDWYDYDLSGYNQYGFDFLGFDRWGYDRSGYDRWGYDHRGYNWAGYNWAGYNRDGWDHDGRNEWGQHRDHPGDPGIRTATTATTHTSSTPSGSSRTTTRCTTARSGTRPTDSTRICTKTGTGTVIGTIRATATGHRRPPPSQPPTSTSMRRLRW